MIVANPSQPTQISGTLVIVSIVVLALGAASFGLWYRIQATDRALALWGVDRAGLIQRGKQVQALRLSPHAASDGQPAGEVLEVGIQTLHVAGLLVTEQRDISAARGLLHLRQALLENRSFYKSSDSGQERAEAEGAEWAFGLRISDGRTALLLVFTRDFEQMAVVEGGRIESVVSIAKKPTAAGLTKFFAEQFEEGQFEERPFQEGQSP